jgi:hypothetical protein
MPQQKVQFEERNSCQRLHFSCPIICTLSAQPGSKKKILSHVCGKSDVDRSLTYCMQCKYFPFVAWHNSLLHIMHTNVILFPHSATAMWAKVTSLSRLHDHTLETLLSLGLLWKSDQSNTTTIQPAVSGYTD